MSIPIDPTTSIEAWCGETIRSLIESMARTHTFKGVANSRMDPLLPASVIQRAYRRPGTNEKTQTGERLEVSPCCIVTVVNHRRPVGAGENNVDDGVCTVVVQICDDVEEPSVHQLPTYSAWMADIRKRILRKPGSHLSPLESMPVGLGQIYTVHVTENRTPDETDWAFHEQMRTALNVECYTRTER